LAGKVRCLTKTLAFNNIWFSGPQDFGKQTFQTMKNVSIWIAGAVLSVFLPSAHAQFTYTTNGSVITITEYTGSGGAVTISNFVTAISSGAFTPLFPGAPNSYATNITTLVIPDSITDLPTHAFQKCTSLLSVNTGNGITNLEAYAFNYCESLTNIYLGTNLLFIGAGVFQTCTNLPSIIIPDSVTSIGGGSFSGLQQPHQCNHWKRARLHTG
jgi:hypothetical protein